MALSDWLADTADRYRTLPPLAATKASAEYLWRGVLRRFSFAYPDGTVVWERDWDVLCILDACRVDVMEAAAADHDWLGAVDSIDSVGSSSPKWMRRTFAPEYRDETERAVYITGNPFSERETSPDDWQVLDEAWQTHWDDDRGTIPPEPLADKTIDAVRTVDADRYLVHFMQPHVPFRGYPEMHPGFDGADDIGTAGTDYTNPWEKVRNGTLTREEVFSAYRDNLEWVLESCRRIVRNVDGTVVLSADHGNGLGEWGVYEHPPDVATPAIRRVPWVELDAENVDDETPAVELERTRRADASTEEVERRLDDLGYL